MLYASLPCVGGSPWEYINRLTDSGAERIEQQQKKEFTKLFNSLQKVINEIDGPHFSIAFELSKNCIYWKWPMVQSFPDLPDRGMGGSYSDWRGGMLFLKGGRGGGCSMLFLKGGRLLSKGRGRGHSKGVGRVFLNGGVVLQGGVIQRGGVFFRGGGSFLTGMTEVSRYCRWALSSTCVALSQHGRKAGKL